MTSAGHLDVLMVGHITKDRLVVDGHAETATGGAVYYGSVALAHLGVAVGVVTRLHPEDYGLLASLRDEGVHVFSVAGEGTSQMENSYDSADMERRSSRFRDFAGAFRPEDIGNLSARVYLVVPIIAGEVDVPLLAWLAKKGPLGLDVQGFLRTCEGGTVVLRAWPDLAAGLAHVTYLKLDRGEAELLTGQNDLCAAARELATHGPREIVITESAGVTVYANGRCYQAPFAPRSLAGRTGRGDTCFAAYVGKRMSASPEAACTFAAAVTTLKLERPGPWRGVMADVEVQLAGGRADGLPLLGDVPLGQAASPTGGS